MGGGMRAPVGKTVRGPAEVVDCFRSVDALGNVTIVRRLLVPILDDQGAWIRWARPTGRERLAHAAASGKVHP